MTDWREEDDPGRSSQALDNYARTLDELEPDGVADQALTALLGHVASLTVGWHIDLLCPRDLEERTDLHDTVQRLTEFAQQGLPVDEWTQPLQAEEVAVIGDAAQGGRQGQQLGPGGGLTVEGGFGVTHPVGDRTRVSSTTRESVSPPHRRSQRALA